MSDTTHTMQTEEGSTQMTTTEAPTYRVRSIYQLQIGRYWEAFRRAESIGRKYYCSEDLSKLAKQMMAKGHIPDALSTYALAAHCWRQTLREYEEINNKTRVEDVRAALSDLLLDWTEAHGKTGANMQATALPLCHEHVDILRKRVLYFKEEAKDFAKYVHFAHELAKRLFLLGALHWQYNPADRTALTLSQEGAQLLEGIASDGGSVAPLVLARARAKLAEIEAAFPA